VKFIIGPLRFRPGERDGFLARIQPIVDTIRREPGCVFFEFNPKQDDADVAFLCECFVDDAAHRLHKTLPHMPELFALLNAAVVGGDVKVHFADELFDDN
jgi:quinol monooxygenase YgiN